MDQLGIPPPGIDTQTVPNGLNITAPVAIPAYIVSHEKNVVAISGPKLAEALDVYYKAGIRRVEAAVIAGGQSFLIDCTIAARHNKQRNRTYLWLYPLQPAQTLFRDLYRKYRGDAPRRSRRPMPVLILALRPK
jgi:hypothetical protein